MAHWTEHEPDGLGHALVVVDARALRGLYVAGGLS
jgi:hypothetical protein